MHNLIKRIFTIRNILAAIVIAAIFYSYKVWYSPTKIGLVNYRDFQAARLIKANDSKWISIQSLSKTATDKYHDFDVIYIFGRGLSLSEQQIKAFQLASEDGVQIVVEASTNPRIDVTNVAGDSLELIQDYFRYGGEFNYQQLLRYSRTHLDDKQFGVASAEDPLVINSDVIFHKDESKIFTKVEDYEKYYKSLPSYSESGKKIALLTSVPGPFNANRDHLDSLIDEFEKQGIRVYPVASFTRRLELMKKISPDAVIMMPHGRLQLGKGSATIDWLKQKNIPLFAPVSVFENYDKWLDNPQGYSSNLLTMNVVMPEIDGAIVPYAINAQFPDKDRLQIFKAIPNRMTSFIGMVNKWFKLKNSENNNKKVAIVYFRGPGKNALVAGNMEVTPSLFNILRELKKQGYDLGNFPEDYSSFVTDLNRQGVVMAPYAEGLIEKFYEQGEPALVSAKEYSKWCYEELADGLCERIDQAYGKSPGNFMVKEEKGERFMTIARLQYGNVVLLPQPLPGIGKDTFKLVHGTNKAPPHSYVAPYMWIRNTFKADAIFHFGTHGSLEFTQGKQVALSEYDWADALIGNTPHFYIYTMSNVGEAIIAKRRSYATILSHLTPPFKESGLYSDLKRLSDNVADYSLTKGGVQQELQQQINKLIMSLNLDQDLQLTKEQLDLDSEGWQQQVLAPISKWLETLAQSKITEGLYTLGNAFNQQQANQTSLLMSIDAIIQSYLGLTEFQKNNFGEGSLLRDQAASWIKRILDGESSKNLIAELVDSDLLKRAKVWNENNKTLNQSEIVKSFIAMSGKGKKQAVEQLEESQLMALTAKAIADPETKKFLSGLSNEQSFSHVVKALDPKMAKRAKVLAKMIPAIGKSLKQLEKQEVKKLVLLMQDSETKNKVLRWVNNDELANLVAEQESKRNDLLSKQLIEKLPKILAVKQQETNNWQSLELNFKLLSDFVAQIKKIPASLKSFNDEIYKQTNFSTKRLIESLEKHIKVVAKKLESSRNKEQQLVDSIKLMQQTLERVAASREHLINGAHNELKSVKNALKGGYILPSSGGDPIVNPSALPTGRNMFSIDAEKTPSIAAWSTGKQLAEVLLKDHFDQTGKYPEKISFTLWPSEFIHTQGATIAEILYLLGVEPVRDPFGRVRNLKLIPAEQLKRPRIDVVVQSAGQLRDLAASRLALIEKAVRMVAKAETDGVKNYVAKGVRDAEQYLLDKGVSPLTARNQAFRRSFGGVNGAYGTAIMSQVEQGDSWQSDKEIAQQYLYNMGAVYGDSETWGDFQPHLFAAALQNTEVVIQPRSSSTWGALSLDHVYEFMGGLNLAVREVTGNDPKAYFNDFRNPNKAKLQTLNEAIWTEVRTTLLNPNYIKSLMEGEASSAETFAETFRNTYGWNVMKPEAIDDSVWNNLHEVYIRDKNKLGLNEFFEKQNPYALQEMTGVMLESARKGLWKASKEQLKELAIKHSELVAKFEAGCGNFTCGNKALQSFITQQIDDVELAKKYQQQLDAAQVGEELKKGVVLTKQEAKKSQATETEKDINQTEQDKPSQSFNAYFIWFFAAALFLILFLTMRKIRARN